MTDRKERRTATAATKTNDGQNETKKPPVRSEPGPIFAYISPQGLRELLNYKYISG